MSRKIQVLEARNWTSLYSTGYGSPDHSGKVLLETMCFPHSTFSTRTLSWRQEHFLTGWDL